MLKRLAKKARKVFGKQDRPPRLDYVGQAASDLIKNMLVSGNPCMISRFGGEIMETLLSYLAIKANINPLNKFVKYIRGEIDAPWLDDQVRFSMSNNAGFFPVNDTSLFLFAEKMLKDIKNINVLGSWSPGERRLLEFMPEAKLVRFPDLEPYYHKDPWSEVLQGRKVLVIHPFAESINRQYINHRLLFKDPRVLPDFDLVTLTAVQSIVGTKVGFATWFDALDWMCEKINGINFEIAIIGAGAYGLPLAAYIKSIGKKSIHLGGSTQILFGIKGKRWDEHPYIKQLYNEHWIRPSTAETPESFQQAETGCYW